jgi:hypothetical protein
MIERSQVNTRKVKELLLLLLAFVKILLTFVKELAGCESINGHFLILFGDRFLSNLSVFIANSFFIVCFYQTNVSNEEKKLKST